MANKSQTALNVISKLLEEARAAKPVVKEASQTGGALMREGQLAPGQKIVQKVLSGDEYTKKMEALKKAAGVAGVATGAGLMTPDDANAAGIETIARKLGVGLEEAAKIKKLALEKVPQSVFDENIKAIQEVSNFKKNPKDYTRLGSGVDYRTFETPSGKVLKEAKDRTKDSDILKVAPSLVEQAGLGPKTKNVQVGDYPPYMIQDKINPLDQVIKKAQRPGGDPELEALYKNHDALWKKVDIRNQDEVNKFINSPENQTSLKNIQNRQNQLLQNQGLDTNTLQQEYNKLSQNPMINESFKFHGINNLQDALENPETVAEIVFTNQARQKIGNSINPKDLHSGNIGFNPEGKMMAFDTSRFSNFNPYNLTPEQKLAIEQSNIALPEKKAALQRILNPDNLKKAAAIAPLVDSNTLIGNAGKDLAGAYNAFREPVLAATSKVGEFVADTVRPPLGQSSEQIQRERDIAGGLSSMAFDPANFIAPGAGMAVGAADLASGSASPGYPSLTELLKGPKKP